MDIRFLPHPDPLATSYSERYAAYITYSNKQKMLEWILDRFDEEITSQLVNKKLQDGKLSVLGIGSGDGKFEVKMLMQLMKKFRLIECTVVEPSGERITSYRDLVKEQKDALDGVTFDWRQETLQEFFKANVDGLKKFHFVSAIHSCYYIAQQELDYYMNALTRRTEGKILIMQDADSIMDSLKNLGISFETSVLPCELDITCCFDDDSRDGKYLLDFLLRLDGGIDNGPPELLRLIKEFLKSEGISYTRNAKIYVTNPTQIEKNRYQGCGERKKLNKEYRKHKQPVDTNAEN